MRGQRIDLPVRPFLWTVDQVATIISLQPRTMQIHYVYYEGRSTGAKSSSKLLARNIAPRDAPAEWRIAQEELIRWLRMKGFRFYEDGRLRD